MGEQSFHGGRRKSEILAEVGYSQEEIASLIASGAAQADDGR